MAYARKSYDKETELEGLKRLVKTAHDYDDHNCKRYNYFSNFILRSTLRATDIQVLADVQKPQVEANVLEAFISRLCGEYSELEQSFVISAAEGAQITPQLLESLKVWGMHLRAILRPNTNDNMLYHLFRELLIGGFGVMELYVDYANPRTMRKKIFADRVFDPTMTYWDPMAMESHRGDGAYCGKLVPMSREGMISEFGVDYVKDVKFTRDLGGFSWSYRTQEDEILLIAEHWKKKYKSVRLTELSDHRTIPVKEYDAFAEMWRMSGVAETVPIPIGKIRTAKQETICRYRFTGNQVIDYKETDYGMFPLVFFDGNGSLLRDESGGTAMRMTRPYVMNCKDTQKVTNFVLQTMANEVENMIQHKYVAAIESIPDDDIDAWRNPQRSQTLAYNAFQDEDPSKPLPAPQVIPRPEIPQSLGAMFQMMQATIQQQLGAYDSALGIQNNELSGVAIQNGAMQSNAASMPYNVGMMQGLNRVACWMMDMIPKTYITPQSIPIKLPNGKRDYIMINQPGGITSKFDPHDLQIEVEAGVNFNIQKQVSLTVLLNLMKASETFSQFMNTEGLETLLDNIDIKGIDALKAQVGQFMQQQKQQQQKQPNPAEMQMQIQQATIKQRDDASKRDFIGGLIKTAATTSVAKEANDVAFISAVGKIDAGAAEREIKEDALDSENARTAVEGSIAVAGHELNVEKHLHEMSMAHELAKKEDDGSNETQS